MRLEFDNITQMSSSHFELLLTLGAKSVESFYLPLRKTSIKFIWFSSQCINEIIGELKRIAKHDLETTGESWE